MNLPKKKDPSITYLNRLGYNVIRVPRTGIEPMDVIGRDQTVQLLGPISDIWKSASPTPVPTLPRPAAAVNGQRTDSLDLSVGLGILANTLAAFGATAPSLKVPFKSAHSVNFSYDGVTATSVDLFQAGGYLAKGDLDTDNPVVKNYFFNEKSSAYLIIEVLKSNSITVTATDSRGMPVEIGIPSIEGLVDAHIQVKPGASGNSSVTFTGTEPVAFGFAVQQITRVSGAWELHGVAPSGNLAFAVPSDGQEEPEDNPMVFDSGPLDCRLDLK